MLHHYGIMYADYWALISWDEFASLPDRMADLTPARLKEVAKRYLIDSDRLIMAFEPVAKIEKTTESEIEKAVERFEAENGLTTIVRYDPTAQVFALHVLIKNRWLYDREFGVGAVDLLHQLLDEPRETKTKGKGRSKPKTINQTDRLDELPAKLKIVDNLYIPFDNYYTTPGYSYIRLETLPDRWQEGVNLVAEMMAEVPINEKALKSAFEQTTMAGAKGKRSTTGQGRKKLRNHLFPGTVLSTSVYGDVSELSIDVLMNLKGKYFQPANVIISISSPIAQEQVKNTILEAFSKLPTSETPPLTMEPFSPKNSLKDDSAWRDTVSLDKLQGAVVMGRIIPDVDAGDRPALVVANSYFNERMSSFLRETLGLAYSLGSSVNLHSGQNESLWGYWEIYVATRKENFERAEDGVNDLIVEMSEHSFTNNEVEKLKNAITGRLLMRSMSRIGQAYAMGIGEFYWDEPGYRERLIKEISEVTFKKVEEVVRKYLSSQVMATVIVK